MPVIDLLPGSSRGKFNDYNTFTDIGDVVFLLIISVENKEKLYSRFLKYTRI